VFVGLLGIGILAEWAMLVWKAGRSTVTRVLWVLFGLVYIGGASLLLANMRTEEADGVGLVLTFVGGVIATDIGAYFVGRLIGGPRIAPSISPSKTWAGLGGGIFAATVFLIVLGNFYSPVAENGWLRFDEPALMAFLGPVIAVVAQAGDFFESWLKRRAEVKDSGRLLPGHGGLLDRTDGLIAVLFVVGITMTLILVFALVAGEPLLPTPA
jgi:phosphatidate cytidylyltransferase